MSFPTVFQDVVVPADVYEGMNFHIFYTDRVLLQSVFACVAVSQVLAGMVCLNGALGAFHNFVHFRALSWVELCVNDLSQTIHH